MKWEFGNAYQISFDPTGHQTCNICSVVFEIWWVQNNWYLQAFSKTFGGGVLRSFGKRQIIKTLKTK